MLGKSHNLLSVIFLTCGRAVEDHGGWRITGSGGSDGVMCCVPCGIHKMFAGW